MSLKPDILEKGENLLDKVDREIVPKVNSAIHNLDEITSKVNGSIVGDVQKTLASVNETVANVNQITSKINRAFPFIVGALCVVGLAVLGTMAGVVVLIVQGVR